MSDSSTELQAIRRSFEAFTSSFSDIRASLSREFGGLNAKVEGLERELGHVKNGYKQAVSALEVVLKERIEDSLTPIRERLASLESKIVADISRPINIENAELVQAKTNEIKERTTLWKKIAWAITAGGAILGSYFAGRGVE